MARVTIDKPALVETKRVDKSGRVYLGKQYRDSHVRVVIESLEDCEKNND